jgi:hypothetical protein
MKDNLIIKNQTNSDSDVNKTIVIGFDDSTRMIESCLYEDKSVTKDFYDWYLIDNGGFFCKKGMLIIDTMLSEKERIAVSFDFTNPDAVEFNFYRYYDQKIICSFFFYRQDNLTMKDVSIDIKHYSSYFFKNQKNIYAPADFQERLREYVKKIGKEYAKKIKSGHRVASTKELLEQASNHFHKEANFATCQQLVYITYALMYYVSKQEPEEITNAFQKQVEIDTGGIKEKSVYKYTGYIDLRKTKVFKPIIKKDPTEPIREYQRHIQKWIVRGHYRKTKNGLIWINEQERGEGELEKRIYGTVEAKDLHLIPKVFEVERSVKQDSEIKIKENVHQLQSTTPILADTDSVVIVKKSKVSLLQRILNFFKWQKPKNKQHG